MSSPEKYDALIIGAGMSGLAAGIRLAQFDLRVCILEKHALWGGLNSFYKLGGHRFDVGLHALTNFVPKGTRGTPLARLLRQLRLSHDDLELREHRFSEIAFPSTKLRFSNDKQLFFSEIERAFPGEIDGFARLVQAIENFDTFDTSLAPRSARAVLAEHIREPLLVEMLMLPTSYYGSAREDDMDWYQFVLIFQAVLLEGFSRPEGGIRTILDLLLARYKEAGGELRLRSGVERVTLTDGRATGVVLENGGELQADCILSSAGWVETLGLCDLPLPEDDPTGRISFIETISVLDREPKELGFEAAVTFFNDHEELLYRVPREDRIEARCGVICSPNNYDNAEPLTAGMLRATVLADYAQWAAMEEESYRAAKTEDFDRTQEMVAKYAVDPRPHTTFTDMFTPRTIEHYTGHVNGAVYGSRRKARDGDIGVPGLWLCGTDQGMLGIVGSMLSGISMANAHVLVQRSVS